MTTPRIPLTFVDALPDLVSFTDKDLRYRYVNSAYVRFFGVPAEELVGKSLQEVIGSDVLETSLPHIRRALAGETVTYEEEFTYPLGHGGGPLRVIMEGRLIPHRSDETGEVDGYYAVLRDVTAERRRDHDRARQAHLLDGILRNLPGVVYQMRRDPDGSFHFPFVGPNVHQVAGATAEELTADSARIFERVHPDDVPALLAAIEESRVSMSTFSMEYRMRDGKGETVWTRSSASPAAMEDGSILWTGVAVAIAEEKRLAASNSEAVARLDRALEELRYHTENSPFAAVEWDEAGTIRSWNRRAEEVFGWTAGEVLGKSWNDFPLVHEDDRPAVEARIGELYGGERSNNVIENRNRTKDGRVVFSRWYNSARRDSDTGAIRIRSLVEDVTAARLAQFRYRAMFDETPEGVAVYRWDQTAQDFRFQDFNPAAERITRVKREEVLGRRLLELFPAMRDYGLWDALRGAYNSGRTVMLPARHYADDIREGWRENIIYRIPSDEVVAIFSDVTERVQEQAELLRAKDAAERAMREAEAANRAKSVFLANMSHEIRTPLNGITGMLTLLTDGPLTLEQREFADAALKSAWRLARLLGDILDLSRIEAGRVQISDKDLDLRELADTILELFAHPAREKGVQVAIGVDPHLETRRRGDGLRLQQILINLVGNAVKFTPEGGTVTVSIAPATETGRSEGLVVFRVADTGEGIAPDLLPRAFDVFVQGETRNFDPRGGAGLGLSIVKQLVELMGGEIELHSSLGLGTVATVTLPLKSTATGR